MTRKEITLSVLSEVLAACDIARAPINWYGTAVDPIHVACHIARENKRSVMAQTEDIYKTACSMGHNIGLGVDMAITEVLQVWYVYGWLKGKEIDQYNALSREV